MYKYALYAIVDRMDGFKVADLICAVNGKEALKQFMRSHALTPSIYNLRKVESTWFMGNEYGTCISAEMVCKISGQLIDSVRIDGDQTVVHGAIGERRYYLTEKSAKRAYIRDCLTRVFMERPEKHRPVIGQCYL